jgi:hypothetical protein
MEAPRKNRVCLVLAVAFAIAACSFNDDKAVSATNTCEKDLECGKGSECKNSLCISTLSSPLQIALQVLPSNVKTVGAEKPGTRSASEETASSTDQSVTMVWPHSWVFGSTDIGLISVPPLVEVSGNIRDNEGERVTARIDFVPTMSYPGIQVQTLTVNTSAQETETKLNSLKEPSDFITQILQNVSYNIAITPQDKLGSVASSELPPFYGEFKAEKKEGTRLDVFYSKYEMEETSFFLHGLPSNQSFKVYAVSTSNKKGRVSTERRIVPGASESPFLLRFSTQPGPYQLVIEPDMTVSSGESEDSIYPTFRITESDLSRLSSSDSSTGDGGVIPENPPIEITLPSPPSAENYIGYIEPCKGRSSKPGQTEGEELIQKGPQTLKVVLNSKELAKLASPNGLTGYISATAVAIYNRKTKRFEFSVQAIPGKYQVVVSPPNDFRCAVFAKTLQLPAPSDDGQSEAMAIQLPLMASITGVFQTPEGEPIIGANILAQALGREGIDVSDQPSLTAYNRSQPATTDEKGAFQISVDLGSYDLIAQPPAGSGFGWQIFHDVNIGVRDADFYLKIDVAKPISISGKVAYSSIPQKADALQGAEIRAFAIITDKDLGTRTVQIASATADEKSRFQLLLSGVLKQGLY